MSTTTTQYKKGTKVWVFWPEENVSRKVYQGTVASLGTKKQRKKNKVKVDCEPPRKGGQPWSAWIDQDSYILRQRKDRESRPSAKSFRRAAERSQTVKSKAKSSTKAKAKTKRKPEAKAKPNLYVRSPEATQETSLLAPCPEPGQATPRELDLEALIAAEKEEVTTALAKLDKKSTPILMAEASNEPSNPRPSYSQVAQGRGTGRAERPPPTSPRPSTVADPAPEEPDVRVVAKATETDHGRIAFPFN